MPPGYAITAIVLWVLCLVVPATIRLETDGSTGDSVLTAIGVPDAVNQALIDRVPYLASFAWVLAIVLLAVQVRWAARTWPAAER